MSAREIGSVKEMLTNLIELPRVSRFLAESTPLSWHDYSFFPRRQVTSHHGFGFPPEDIQRKNRDRNLDPF
jgi:hypothetical protein